MYVTLTRNVPSSLEGSRAQGMVCIQSVGLGASLFLSPSREERVSGAIARKRVKQTWKDKSETVGRAKAEAQIQYSLAVPSGSRMISFPACLMLAVS